MICNDCPRRCGVLRPAGYCGMPEKAVVARAALHFGEEPCISGKRGSGTVFFSGCNLRCVFCQNRAISRRRLGRETDASELRDIFFRLIAAGAHNINLVTPSHYVRVIREALGDGLPVPVVWNSGGYDSAASLWTLKGKVSVFMPDMKYSDPALAASLSGARDYVDIAAEAILEMYRMTGRYKLDGEGMLQSGVLVRHLVLPGRLENTYGVIDWVRDTFPRGSVLFSLMGQYTPAPETAKVSPELGRALTAEEYAAAAAYLEAAGIADGYLQEPDASGEEMLPLFGEEEIV